MKKKENNYQNDLKTAKNSELKEELKNPLDELKVANESIEELPKNGNAEVLKAIENNSNLIKELAENIKGGFSSMGDAMSSLSKPSQDKDNVEDASSLKSSGGNYSENPRRKQHSIANEYRESLRQNMPLKSFMGISKNLKASNINSYT